jgi:hypothetical protein
MYVFQSLTNDVLHDVMWTIGRVADAFAVAHGNPNEYQMNDQHLNQMYFIKPFLHQQLSQSALQIPGLNTETAEAEAQWLGTTPRKAGI